MKLYIITRADLSPGARAAQACHTLHAFVHQHPDVDRAWHDGSNNLVVLEVANEAELVALRDRAVAAGVPHATFHEPDFGGSLTGVALGPRAKPLVSSIRLALRDVGQPALDRAS